MTYDEISQIAGRAGRYLNGFGTTGNLKSLSQESISFIENRISEIQKFIGEIHLLVFCRKNHYLTQ